MAFKGILLFVLLWQGSGVMALTGSDAASKCDVQLALALAPTACYAESGSKEEIDFLDRKCEMAAKNIISLGHLVNLLKNERLSKHCFKALKDRGEVLAYKLEDKKALQAFRFKRVLIGLKFENLKLHADTRSSQSN